MLSMSLVSERWACCALVLGVCLMSGCSGRTDTNELTSTSGGAATAGTQATLGGGSSQGGAGGIGLHG